MSDSDKEKPFDPEVKTSSPREVENAGTTEVVDKMTERKLMAKLDRRIIPMIMWMYLVNFMDRGMSLINITLLKTRERIIAKSFCVSSCHWKRSIVRHGRRSEFDGGAISDCCFCAVYHLLRK